MRKRITGGNGFLLVAGISFAIGILVAIFLPNVLLIVILTLLLLSFCVLFSR